MKIALTASTDRNLYVSLLAERLAQAGFAVDLILSVAPTSLFRRFKGRVGDVVRAHQGANAALDVLGAYARRQGLEAQDDVPRLCAHRTISFERAPAVNSAEAVGSVRHHAIDLLLNGGGGLFRQPLLDAVRVGVLNPHMGRLPHYRGYNVMEWMVLAGEQPCSTLHFVDAGVDTGDILLHRPIGLDELPADLSIQGVRDRMGPIHIELLVEGVRRLHEGTLSRVAQRPEQGRQYFAMHPLLKAQAQQRLRIGGLKVVTDPHIPRFP